MNPAIPKQTLTPPAGRPSWRGEADLPLIYLGWGRRDFSKHPVQMHYDLGTNYYLVERGEIKIQTDGQTKFLRGPAICLFDSECPFGISQTRRETVSILVWIWRGLPLEKSLMPPPGGFQHTPLGKEALSTLAKLHERCRDEVALADAATPAALEALHRLLDIEICRATQPLNKDQSDLRWKLACAWIASNLAIHAPVPALSDYLRMSPNTLHRLFNTQAGVSPGSYFRQKKLQEGIRLVDHCRWPVKVAAFHLGYRHSNDLSRALTKFRQTQLRSTQEPSNETTC